MKKKSKRYRQGAEKIAAGTRYPLADAVKLLGELPAAKFDETVEMALCLGIDPKQTDQLVRGTVALPHGTGKKVRIVVFAKGAQADEAKEAGADVVGFEELIKKVSGGWAEFDMAVTSPDLMKEVGRLGKVLGPRGLMPSPKTGTVTDDVAAAVKASKGGKVDFRMDRTGNVCVLCGKRSFEENKLVENIRVIVDAVKAERPAGAKGIFVRTLTVSSTMGVGVHVLVKEFE